MVRGFRDFINEMKLLFDPQSPQYKWWVLANVMIGTFMAVLDATIVNVGLPKIMSAFGVGIDKIEWVLTAYLLSMAVMLPTAAWLAERFGFKRMYFAGLFFFTLGSFLCGISGEENMLIISRIIQGLGAGAIQPIGMAIITREFPPNRRGVALGFWAIAAAASVSFGPLLGGFLIDNFNWQLIFDINVPVGIMGLFATVVIQKEYRNPNVRNFDTIGFISISLFLPLILYALTESNAASNAAGWYAPHVLICVAVSIISLAVFITTELIIKEPLIDLRLLKNHNFGIANAIMFLFGIGMFGSTFLLPLYLQNSLGYTAIQAGSVFLPVGIIQGVMSPVSGLVGDKINPKIPIILGITLLALSFYLNSQFSFLTEHNYIMLILYIRGFAMGMLFSPLSSVSLTEISRDHMAQASSIFNVVRQLGGSFGVAILATILTTRVNFHTEAFSTDIEKQSPAYANVIAHASTQYRDQAGYSPSNAKQLGQSTIVQQVNKEAFIQGVDDDFLIAGLITILGVIPVLFLHTKKRKEKSPGPVINE